MDDALDRLYAVPLEDFVSERTRLSRELRKTDRPAAAELAKLPKPSAAAWALNHVAREDPETMGEWLATAEALRDASEHAADVGGDAVRSAMAAHREATQRLTTAVRAQARPGGKALSDAMLERVRGLLQAATADPALAERLRAGRVSEDAAEAEPAEEDEIVWTAAPSPSRRSRAPSRRAEAPAPAAGRGRRSRGADPPAPAADAETEARAARVGELERLAADTEAEVEQLRAEAAEANTAAEAAEARVEEARKALTRSESAAEAARAAAADAEQAAAAAERDLQQVRQRLRRARD